MEKDIKGETFSNIILQFIDKAHAKARKWPGPILLATEERKYHMLDWGANRASGIRPNSRFRTVR